MRSLTGDWSKLLNGVLAGALIFFTLLPSLGWAWHRVLPEHTHILLTSPMADGSEAVAASSESLEQITPCTDCPETRISSGVIHLPSAFGEQILAIAILVAPFFRLIFPLGFTNRVIVLPIFYQSPVLLLPDPPPNRRASSR